VNTDVAAEESSELSGYETDSSASTDIDAVVAEFKEQIQVATVTAAPSMPELPLSIEPDATSSRKARLALTTAFLTGTIVCATFLMVKSIFFTTKNILSLIFTIKAEFFSTRKCRGIIYFPTFRAWKSTLRQL